MASAATSDPGTSAVEATFGERARRLEARARLDGRAVFTWDRYEVRLALAASALTPAERTALEGEPALRLEPHAAPEGPAAGERASDGTDTAYLTGETAALRRVVERHAGLAPLLAAHTNALAPPWPEARPRPRLFGVLNVTPDSFSDGGRFLDPDTAVAHAAALVEAGADVIDVGGESTRPGAAPVGTDEELRRVLPVVERLAATLAVPLSVDTRKSAVARRALAAGATIVNDVSAARDDPEMVAVVAEHGAELVLMHMAGTPDTMQVSPSYLDPLREVLAFLRERVASCLKAGIATSRITVDPGIGFGKRLEDNLALVRGVPGLRSLGLPVLLGVSRKSFLGRLSGAPWEADKVAETASAVTASILFGAGAVRVHDVAEMAAASAVATALAGQVPPGRAED